MWVGSVRSTPCTSANEVLGTLAENNPLTVCGVQWVEDVAGDAKGAGAHRESVSES